MKTQLGADKGATLIPLSQCDHLNLTLKLFNLSTFAPVFLFCYHFNQKTRDVIDGCCPLSFRFHSAAQWPTAGGGHRIQDSTD